MSAFSEQLWNLPADLNASLLHGSVCGLLCAAPAESSESYRRALTDLLDAVERMDVEELDRFIWYAADDTATDFSFYTKRATLAGIFGAALLYWLDDHSVDFAETGAERGEKPAISVRRGAVEKTDHPLACRLLRCRRPRVRKRCGDSTADDEFPASHYPPKEGPGGLSVAGSGVPLEGPQACERADACSHERGCVPLPVV